MFVEVTAENAEITKKRLVFLGSLRSLRSLRLVLRPALSLGRETNALDLDGRQGFALLPAIIAGDGHVADAAQDVVALGEPAKAVYFRSRNEASPRQMKNWLPAESGCCARAIEMTPRWWERSLNSARMVRPGPPCPSRFPGPGLW